ncbi:MAG: hypothetical protein JHC93_05935 [Parachlamydiales bacterium]|nr:hypothetical protein [Parachlamydiales bacterium]
MLCNTAKRRRKLSFLLLLILSNILAHSCFASHWQLSSLETRHSLYSSGKIFYPAENEITGLELSFIKNSNGLRGIISVFCREIQCYKDNFAIVTLYINGKSINLLAKCFEGRQQLLIDKDTTELMLNTLKNEESFIIYLNGYESLINSDRFEQSWRWLQQLPICQQKE